MKSIKQLLAEFNNTSEQQPDITPSGVEDTAFLFPEVGEGGKGSIHDADLRSALKGILQRDLTPDEQERLEAIKNERERLKAIKVNPERPASAKYDYGEPGHIIGQPPPTTRFTRFGDK